MFKLTNDNYESRLVKLEERMNTVEKDISEIKSDISSIKTSLVIIQTSIARLEGKKEGEEKTNAKLWDAFKWIILLLLGSSGIWKTTELVNSHISLH